VEPDLGELDIERRHMPS